MDILDYHSHIFKTNFQTSQNGDDKQKHERMFVENR